MTDYTSEPADAPLPQYAGPDELAAELLEPQREPLRIDDTALRCLLRAVYGASLRPEEGHYPRLMLHVPLKRDTELAPSLCFVDPIPLTAETLRKLSPAVPPYPLALVVDQAAEQRSTPVAIGTRRIDGGGFRLMPQLDYRVAVYNVGVYVRIDGPGAISVTDARVPADIRLWSLSGGRLVQGLDVFDCPVLGQASTDAYTAGVPNPHTSGAEQYHRIQRVLRGLLARVLGEASSIGHGGAFLQLPAGSQLSDVSAHLKLNHLVTSRVPLIELLQVLLNHDPSPLSDPAEERARTWEVQDRLKSLLDSVTHTARLSAMDGCVVLSRSLEPLAFGAKILTAGDVKCWRMPDRSMFADVAPYDLQRHGTRHGSVARFVGAVQGSRAFVISQDGEIRAFEHRGPGKVGVCEPYGCYFGSSPLEI